MNFDKQYLSQLISVSANHLRLSTEKIESVGLLKEMLLSQTPLDERLKQMKKVTEFARLAVRLSEIYNYLHQSKIDFLNLSEKFKEHSQLLIKEISVLLDSVNITQLNAALFKLEQFNTPPPKEDVPKPIEEKRPRMSVFIEEEKITSILKDDDTRNDLSFQDYESSIMRPIKHLDNFFKRIGVEDIHHDEYTTYSKALMRNADLSEKFGIEIISNMHRIVAKSLLLIKSRELMPGKEIIEAMRACLIVIVALVKGKEVDISVYLNRAEEFGRKIKMMKVKD